MLVKNKKRGFTLIELLVVIAIIGILATIVLVSLNTARAKARDARRSSDLHQIALAMEMYYDSQSPVSYPNVDGVTNDFVLIAAGSSIGTYMNPVPLDPNNTAGPPDLRYYWTDGGTPATKYCVYGRLEVPSTATWTLSTPNGTKQTTTQPTSANCLTL